MGRVRGNLLGIRGPEDLLQFADPYLEGQQEGVLLCGALLHTLNQLAQVSLLRNGVCNGGHDCCARRSGGSRRPGGSRRSGGSRQAWVSWVTGRARGSSVGARPGHGHGPVEDARPGMVGAERAFVGEPGLKTLARLANLGFQGQAGHGQGCGGCKVHRRRLLVPDVGVSMLSGGQLPPVSLHGVAHGVKQIRGSAHS